MAISVVPLQAVANQSVAITLANQGFVITVSTLSGTDDRQYFSLSINGNVLCQNVLMVNAHAIAQMPYSGMIGDFAVIDMQGDEPPLWTGWGSRWLLVFNDAV